MNSGYKSTSGVWHLFDAVKSYTTMAGGRASMKRDILGIIYNLIYARLYWKEDPKVREKLEAAEERVRLLKESYEAILDDDQITDKDLAYSLELWETHRILMELIVDNDLLSQAIVGNIYGEWG